MRSLGSSQAFPMPAGHNGYEGYDRYGHQHQNGMTVRTYMATAMLAAIASDGGAYDPAVSVVYAVQLADALIAELEK